MLSCIGVKIRKMVIVATSLIYQTQFECLVGIRKVMNIQKEREQAMVFQVISGLHKPV